MKSLRYVYNLFAFPEGYFEQHTAEELEICEEDRQELIKIQSERTNSECSEDRKKQRLSEFMEQMGL